MVQALDAVVLLFAVEADKVMRHCVEEARVADPFQRLERRPVGAHLVGLSDLVLKVHARGERPIPEPPTLNGAERAVPSGATRRAARIARPEPNAPQLIRVVKTPYSLSPGRGRRARIREARERLQGTGRARPFQEVLAALQRPALSSPAGTRPRGEYPVVPRDLASRYLIGQETEALHEQPGDR